MTLNKLEKLIQEANDVLTGKQETGLEIAREISSISKSCKTRLQQISFSLSKGNAIQALQLAEEPPAIQDILRLLGFNKAFEWKKLCQTKGWPTPEEPDDNMILQLNEAYSLSDKNKSGRSGLVDAYRGKMMKGNRLEALALLKAYLRKSPNDSWALGELNNTEEAEIQSQYQKLQKYLLAGDEPGVVVQMDTLDQNALGRPNEEIYQRGFRVRKAFRKKEVENDLRETLARLRKWKEEDRWAEAVQYSDDLRQRAREFEVYLPQQGELFELLKWADARRVQVQRKGRITNLETLVRDGLARLEEERGRQIKKRRPELVENLADLDRWHREATELAHRWEGGLEQRFNRELSLLRDDERSAARRANLAIVGILLLAMSCLLTGGWFVYKENTKNNEKKRISSLINEREFVAAEGYLRQKEKDLEGELLSEKERLIAFLEREKALRDRTKEELKKFSEILKRPERKWGDEIADLDRLRQLVASLPKDFQAELSTEKDRLESEWLKATGEQKKKISDDEKAELSKIGEELENVNEEQGAAYARLQALQARLGSLADRRTGTLEPIRSGESVASEIRKIQQKMEAKIKVVKTILDCRKRLVETAQKGDVDGFRAVLNQMSESTEIPAKIAEKAREASSLSKDPAVLSARLWMPYKGSDERTGAPRLASSNFSFFPSGLPLPKEKEAAERLLGQFMDEVYVYSVPDPNRQIYVRGKIQNFKREENGDESAINIFIYDPENSAGSAKFVKTPKIKVASRGAVTFAPEPLFEFLRKTKIIDLAKRFASEEEYPKVSEPVLAGLMDQLMASESLDPLGRGYVARCLKELSEAGIRPEKFGLEFSPSLQKTFSELQKMPAVEEGEWLWSQKRKDLSKIAAYKTLLTARPEAPGFARETVFLAALANCPPPRLVGCVDEGGGFPDLGEGYFLVPEGNGVRLFKKERHGLPPFCPIYKIENEPTEAIKKAAARAGIDQVITEKLLRDYLPVFAEGIKQ